VRVIAINYPGYEPWDLEMEAARRIGADLEVVTYEEFRARTRECDAIINGGCWPFPVEVLDRTGNCKFILSFGTGLDWIDLHLAAQRGITIANTPLANVESVATHTLALILACVRRVVELDQRVKSGRFDLDGIEPMRSLHERRLGLLSFGNVPRRVCELVKPFKMSVVAYDPFVPADVMQPYGVQSMSLESLLGSADILSVHTPATKETVGLLNEERLRLLPKGAIVIVTSRGAVYDSAALARLLQEGHIAGAGLDVFPDEPLRDGDPLTAIPAAVLTPHAAGHARDVVEAYHSAAAAALVALHEGRAPDWVVQPGVGVQAGERA
jgi:D-3-phosphoglycerate dehydrogenase